MFPIQDQLSEAARTGFQAQVATFTTLAGKTFESMEKLFDLNFNLVRASVEESTDLARQMLSAKDPQELFSIVTSQAQPSMEKALSYSRHLANIATAAQSEMGHATETQMDETSRKLVQLVEDAGKNAPLGSENVVAIVKTVIDNANSSVEQLSKTAKQATDAIEASMTAAAAQMAQAAQAAQEAQAAATVATNAASATHSGQGATGAATAGTASAAAGKK